MNPKSAWNRLGRSAALSTVIVATVFIGCGTLQHFGELEYPELKTYDLLISHRSRGPDAGNVVLLGVDEGDIRSIRHYPLSDDEKSRIVAKLAGFGARAIGIDIYLDLATSPTTQPSVLDPGRQALKEQLMRNRMVICPEFWGDANFDEPEIPPPDFLTGRRRIGFIDQPIDRDSVLRRAWLYQSHRGPMPATGPSDNREKFAEPSLSLNVANRFLESDGTLKPDREDLIHLDKFWSLRIPRFQKGDGPWTREEDSGYQYIVNYDGPRSFPTFSLRQLNEMDDATGKRTFGGKAVIVGMAADSIKDQATTPLQVDMFGLAQHARLVDQLIRIAHGARPIRALPNWMCWLWALLWTICAGIAAYLVRSMRLVLIAMAGLTVIVLAAIISFHFNYWIPLFSPALSWMLSMALVTAYLVGFERGARETMKTLFDGSVQKEVADELWERREEILSAGGLKPRKSVATLLFTDLKGFTNLSEHLDPKDLIGWLNEYLSVMTDIVTSHGGTVMKYMGDGIMVAFGTPLSRGEPQDAQAAVVCALEMRRKMNELRSRWTAEKRPSPMMRVGIFTGDSVAGSVGSRKRQEYTLLGDTTNTASRLESFDKKLMDDEVTGGSCRILIGARTYSHVVDRVRVRDLGPQEISGREDKVVIYAVLA